MVKYFIDFFAWLWLDSEVWNWVIKGCRIDAVTSLWIHIFWEGHKIWPLLHRTNLQWRFPKIFVAFSEYMNFTKQKLGRTLNFYMKDIIDFSNFSNQTICRASEIQNPEKLTLSKIEHKKFRPTCLANIEIKSSVIRKMNDVFLAYWN